MPRVMPTRRSYGTIGPNVFSLYLDKTGTDIEALICGKVKDHGVFNGKEWPLSMTECHEGHLAALLNAAKFRLSINDSAVAVVWIKIILDERKYLSLMNFQDTLGAVFDEAEQLADKIKLNLGESAFSSIDPLEWFNRSFGNLPTDKMPAPIATPEEPPNLLTFNPGRFGNALLAAVISAIKIVPLSAVIGIVLAIMFRWPLFWWTLGIGTVGGFISTFRSTYDADRAA